MRSIDGEYKTTLDPDDSFDDNYSKNQWKRWADR